MRAPLVPVLCAALLTTSLPALAADAAPAPAAAPAAKEDMVGKVKKYLLARPKDGPSRLERIIVASGAGVVSVVGLGAGIGFGAWALSDYLCLRDIKACNDRKPDGQKITGTNFLTARQVGERKALAADMGYLVAGTFALVCGLGLAAAFWPSGWWPFAADDAVEVAQPAQVVTEIPQAAPAQPAAGGGAK